MRHLRCAKHRIGETTAGMVELSPGLYGLPAGPDGPAERYRIVTGRAKSPRADQRTITVYTEGRKETRPLALDHYDCDLCGQPIRPGDTAHAVTAWPASHLEPPIWEGEYLEPPATMPRAARPETPWMVRCRTDGAVFLTADEYAAQIAQPDLYWRCPICGAEATWDDENYEKHYPDQEPAE